MVDMELALKDLKKRKACILCATALCSVWIDIHTFDGLQQPIMAERHKWKRFRVLPVIANESLLPNLPIKKPSRKKAFRSVAARAAVAILDLNCGREFVGISLLRVQKTNYHL